MITVMLSLTITMNNALYETSNRANTKAYVTVVDSIMYTDINVAGNNVVPGNSYWISINGVSQWVTPDAVFWTANSHDCEFFADINNGGIPELVEYYAFKDATTGLYTLTRTVNDWKSPNPPVIGKNFTSVKFTYYDWNGAVTTDRFSVASVRIQVTVQIPGATSGFTTAFGDFKVFPANL